MICAWSSAGMQVLTSTQLEAASVAWGLGVLLAHRWRYGLDEWQAFKAGVMMSNTAYGIMLQQVDQGGRIIIMIDGEA